MTRTFFRSSRQMDPLFIGSLVVFAIPLFLALTTYPPYYEDESWLYLPTFEALRGNGLTFAAFHEGSIALCLFNVFGLIVMWLAHASAESSVRAISFVFSFSCLPAVYCLARCMERSKAYVAPVILVLTPLWYLRVRYGRYDGMALALAMWALVAAARSAPLSAGILSGMSVSVHPVFVWVGPACLVLMWRQRPAQFIRRYVAGGVLGLGPQLVWTVSHLNSIGSIVSRYYVTSSVNHGWTAWLGSIGGEFQRYRAYVRGLPAADLAVQCLCLLILPVLAFLGFRGRERLIVILLVALPLLSLALLVAGKNPLYFIYALPVLAVVSAAGGRWLPQRLMRTVCAAALLWSGVRHVNGALQSSRDPTVGMTVEALSGQLPPNAVVFSPLVFASLIHHRPDLRFFTYHSISTRSGWTLPPCASMATTIRSLVTSDPRRVPGPAAAPDKAFFVRWEFEEFLQYFRSIYADATAGDLLCVLGSANPQPVKVCGTDPSRCVEVDVISRDLTANSAAPSPPASDVLRVRAGDSPYIDTKGQGWAVDTAYQEGAPFSTVSPIAGTSDPVLYQTGHVSTRGTLTHRFVVQNGTYLVMLKFAEIYFTAANQRIFDVCINGEAKQLRLDIFAAAGAANKALDVQYPVTVKDGILTITLRAIVGNPTINAIELHRTNQL